MVQGYGWNLLRGKLGRQYSVRMRLGRVPARIAASACGPPNLRHFLVLVGCRADTSCAACRSSNNSGQMLGVTATVPDRLLPAVAFDAYLAEPARRPALAERFLPPREFVWGSFTASDGAVLRWGHLPVQAAIRDIAEPRAACVIAVGFGEFIEKHFETMRDLAGSRDGFRVVSRLARPGPVHAPHRGSRLDRAPAISAATPTTSPSSPGRTCRRTCRASRVAQSMGGAIALVCLRRYPGLFAGAALSSPMVGFHIGRLPPTLVRVLTVPARAAGLGHRFIPGAREWRPDHVPTRKPAASPRTPSIAGCVMRGFPPTRNCVSIRRPLARWTARWRSSHAYQGRNSSPRSAPRS